MKTNKVLIGNLMVFLAEHCKPLYHTKLLKLLYLIDEASVKRTGAPITWLSYNAWQFGPVSEDVYFSKTNGYNKFSEFVSFEHVKDNSYFIRPVAKFDDSEFSEMDMEIINDVIAEYGHMRSEALVSITHAKDSLWNKTKKRANLQFSDSNKTSSVELNFVDLLDDDFKRTIYYSTLENIELQSTQA